MNLATQAASVWPELVALVTAIAPALVGLVGVLIGAWIVLRSENNKAKRERIQRQLDEFYGPLHAMTGALLAQGEVSEELVAYAQASGASEMEARANEHEYTMSQVVPPLLALVEHYAANTSLAESATLKVAPRLAKNRVVLERIGRDDLPMAYMMEWSEHPEGPRQIVQTLHQDAETQIRSLKERLLKLGG